MARSVTHVICPHCNSHFKPTGDEESGIVKCPHCLRNYELDVVKVYLTLKPEYQKRG